MLNQGLRLATRQASSASNRASAGSGEQGGFLSDLGGGSILVLRVYYDVYYSRLIHYMYYERIRVYYRYRNVQLVTPIKKVGH